MQPTQEYPPTPSHPPGGPEPVDVRHPHVCPIYDVGDWQGRPYVVMAYIEGESLATRLSHWNSAQDRGAAVTLVRQVLDALEAIHGHGIIHRDLKPANILLDSDGQVLVTDFGLARSLEDHEPWKALAIHRR